MRHGADGGKGFTYEKTDRGHQRFRVVEVDARTEAVRYVIDERSNTFVNTYTDPYLEYLGRSDEILFKSERDGWAHLYLIDEKTGEVKAQVTRGEWVVRGVDRVDETKRQVWFRASGRNPGEDPYHVHHYRVNLDGTDLIELTEGDGDHTVQYSPGRKYLIDTWSRVDMPPAHAVRRASDGKLVCELERADVSALEAAGWRAPEVFHAKGRDGKTDIWGIVHRPSKLDPDRSYPVIEEIYAGPHGAHVPKRFSAMHRASALAELGFVVVQIDGMGTAHRSKAFHDVCWHNLADAGFPDRILWIKALAEKYPYLDTTRVGIHGTSAGGQNAAGAVLFHPEFYKAAVAACGCHDNRMDKASWNEQWMGYPVGPHYAENSNITHAAKLRGKLLLIVGELDTNVPPESTYRFADALIRAGKDFDLLTIPGAGHTDGGPYGERRRRDFFVRHLHHVEPPDHNAPPDAPVEPRAEAGAASGGAPSVEPVDPEVEPGWPLTRAERTGYRETSSLADVQAFLKALKERGAPVEVSSIGKTAGGLPVVMAVASRPAVTSAVEARAAGKLIVYVQANIHGGEVEGKEAAQMLLRAVARNEGGADSLLDRLVLVVVPVYNADGNEAWSDGAKSRPSQDGPDRVGARPDGAGLDLNRDAIKARAPETQALLGHVYNVWEPDLVLDLHTTNGTRHGYLLTYAPPLNPNTEPEILRLARDEILPAVRDRLKREKDWLLNDYGNVENREGKRAWYTFGDEGRYVTNYVGLRNRIGILSEAASFQPFQTRVETTYAFVRAVLDEAVSRTDRIRQAVRAADRGLDPKATPTLGVRFEAESRGDESIPLEVVPSGTAIDHRKAPAAASIRREKMPVFDRFRATRTSRVPAAYVLPPESRAAVELLRLHGIQVKTLAKPWNGPSEVFEVGSRVVRRQSFQGGELTRLEGRFETRTQTIPAGSSLISTGQPLGRMVFHLLEPEGLDGLTAWGLLDRPALKLQGAEIPETTAP
ncbi:MAG: prolyl oligopeptidase family serine peptidase [Isosphaeraceae bacterium]